MNNDEQQGAEWIKNGSSNGLNPASPTEGTGSSSGDSRSFLGISLGTPVGAMLLSWLIYPGSGQCLNKQVTKGVITIVIFTLALVAFFLLFITSIIGYYSLMDYDGDTGLLLRRNLLRSLIPGGVAFVIYLWSGFDAYYNFKRRQ